MRFSKNEFDKVWDQWPSGLTDSYESATKLVYGWVKQDKVSPAQMADLLVDAYKYYVY